MRSPVIATRISSLLLQSVGHIAACRPAKNLPGDGGAQRWPE
jgi:hypothetical protein